MKSEKPDKRLLGAGVVIIKDGKILLGYQTRSYEQSCWATPGGKIDPGETIEQAMIRETEEECGLKIMELEPITFFEEISNGVHIISFVLKANEFSGTPVVKEPSKCKQWQWFDVNHLPDKLTANLRRLINSQYWQQIVAVA